MKKQKNLVSNFIRSLHHIFYILQCCGCYFRTLDEQINDIIIFFFFHFYKGVTDGILKALKKPGLSSKFFEKISGVRIHANVLQINS